MNRYLMDFQRLRILLLVSESPPLRTGVARTSGSLARDLRARGHDVEVISASEGRRLIVGEFRLSDFATRLPAIARKLSSYDIINLHGPLPSMSDVFFVAYKCLPAQRRPALVYTHNFQIDLDRMEWACSVYNRVHRWLARVADHIIVSTPSYRRLFDRTDGASVSVVPWGIERRFRDNGRAHTLRSVTDSLGILFVGQIRSYKGIAQLLRAVADRPQLKLTVAGAGPLSQRYERLSEALPNVSFLGRVSDEALEELYASHDVIALPSLKATEAFGLVLLEGMAAGCIPVASDLPGVRDVAGPTGLLTRPGNVQDLQRAFEALARDPNELMRRGKASQEHARPYSTDATADRYENIFKLEAERRGLIEPRQRYPLETMSDDLSPTSEQRIGMLRNP